MDDLPKNVYAKLINYRKQNKSIITLFDWCEIYLERIPSFLVTKTDVIRGILNSEKKGKALKDTDCRFTQPYPWLT